MKIRANGSDTLPINNGSVIPRPRGGAGGMVEALDIDKILELTIKMKEKLLKYVRIATFCAWLLISRQKNNSGDD